MAPIFVEFRYRKIRSKCVGRAEINLLVRNAQGEFIDLLNVRIDTGTEFTTIPLEIARQLDLPTPVHGLQPGSPDYDAAWKLSSLKTRTASGAGKVILGEAFIQFPIPQDSSAAHPEFIIPCAFSEENRNLPLLSLRDLEQHFNIQTVDSPRRRLELTLRPQTDRDRVPLACR